MKFARKFAIRLVVAGALIGAPHAVMAQSVLPDDSYGGGWKLALVNGALAAITTIGAAACSGASGLAADGIQSMLGGS